MRLTKKYFYLFALMTLVAFTSCTNTSDDETIQTFTAPINNRAIDGSDVVFSQGTVKVEVNYTQMTMQLNSDFKDIDGVSRNFSTTSMKLTAKSNNIYQFTGAANGYVDLTTGMLWYTFTDGYPVYCTTHLVYAYLTTTVNNADGRTYHHTQSGYIFALDNKGETATMQMTNYVPDAGGAIQASLLEYSGLHVTPTNEGYVITADEAECYPSNYYNIQDLEVNITLNGMLINGSFKIKDHTYRIEGYLYGDKM